MCLQNTKFLLFLSLKDLQSFYWKNKLQSSSILSLSGRRIFQEAIINVSYCTRGKQHRTQMNIKFKINTISIIFHPLKNIDDVIKFRNIIIPYSAIKINANNPPPYSTLNPDTISDSPSYISNGVRLDSAIQIIIHLINTGEQKIAIHKFSWLNLIIFILIVCAL